MAAPAPHEKITVVSVLDPALDRRPVAAGGMDIRRYQETRDPDLIKEIPGKHARRYLLRPLDTQDMDAVESSRVPSRFGFQFALESVINFKGVYGSTWKPRTAIERNNEARFIVGDDEVSEASEGARKVVHELGAVAIERANVGFFLGGAVRFVPLRSLDEELERIARHLADSPDPSESETKTSSPPSSENPAAP